MDKSFSITSFDLDLHRLVEHAAMVVLLHSHQMVADHELDIVINRRKVPFSVYLHKSTKNRVKVLQHKHPLVKYQLTVLTRHLALPLQPNVTL